MIKPVGRFVADQGPLLEIAILSLKRNGMVASTEIQARDVKRDARAGAGVSLGRSRSGRLSRRYFKAQTISEGVAAGLNQLEIYVLVSGLAFRILHCHLHGIENTEIVKTPLRLQHLLLA